MSELELSLYDHFLVVLPANALNSHLFSVFNDFVLQAPSGHYDIGKFFSHYLNRHSSVIYLQTDDLAILVLLSRNLR